MKRAMAAIAWLSAMSAHAASAETAEQAMAAWVPPSVMLAIIAVLGGIVVKAAAARLDKMELTQEKILERLPAFVTTAQFETFKHETNASLGRLGDRMDGRITTIAGAVEVLKDRVDSRSTRRRTK